MEVTITMNEDEIISAIKNFLVNQEMLSINKDVEVNMVAGRGTNGHSAVIKVSNEKLVQDTDKASGNGLKVQEDPASKKEAKAKDTVPPAEPKVTAPASLKGTDVTPTDSAALFGEPDPTVTASTETVAESADPNELGESMPDVTETLGAEEQADVTALFD